MGKKIVNIGDIHGRIFWKLIDINQYDHIVFVGDYVDSYPYDDEHILSNLLDIIELKKNYPDKVILLLGNHDIQYMFLSEGFECSGYRPSMASTLQHVFKDNKRLFQMAFQMNDYIWTHAGIAEKWYDYNKKEIDQFSEKFDCENLADTFNKMMYSKENRLLHQVGRKRSGYYPAGGITWADRYETSLNPFKGYHQIVGHTPIDRIEKFGDENGSIRYIDTLHKLEYFKNLDNIRLDDYFYVLDLE
jgi:predicted MPP superfamily phosphohydrolase